MRNELLVREKHIKKKKEILGGKAIYRRHRNSKTGIGKGLTNRQRQRR
jgi:hypothetical protein